MSLEARVYKRLKSLKNKSVLIAVSGGRDSITLFDLLLRIQKRLGLKPSVLHCHHGFSSDKKINEYRNEVSAFVQETCLFHKTPFFLVKNKEKELKSEAEMRIFRRKSYEDILKNESIDYACLAHHWDDQLETRLIQLIRGTGNLNGMRLFSPPYIRPFLFERGASIRAYCQHHDIQWMEDPTNKNMRFLRNWIRHKWLRDLENKRAGGIEAFSRSLELIAKKPSIDGEKNEILEVQDRSLDRRKFMSLGWDRRRAILHKWLKEQGLSSFSFSQIEEALKRLNRPIKDSQFCIGGCCWTIDTQYIRVERTENESHGFKADILK